MDVENALRQLYHEKQRLDKVIAGLEVMQQAGIHEVATTPKRGRKVMTLQERQAVSRRMSIYWAEHRIATA